MLPHRSLPGPAIPSAEPPDSGTAGTSACFGAGSRASRESRAEQGEGELQSSKAALSQAARHKFRVFFISPTSCSVSLCCLKHP